MKVRNMTSGKTGGAVPNQLIIEDGDKETFQSYDSVICVKLYDDARTVTLDSKKWDYSKTTGRYRNQFLGETKAETVKKINSGEYILADLNG